MIPSLIRLYSATKPSVSFAVAHFHGARPRPPLPDVMHHGTKDASETSTRQDKVPLITREDKNLLFVLVVVTSIGAAAHRLLGESE
jgi:hypothetical protein